MDKGLDWTYSVLPTESALDICRMDLREPCAGDDIDYRRGYLDGYEKAVEDLGRMWYSKGFRRSSEVFNILSNFLRNTLQPWRFFSDNRGVEAPPPKLKQDLGWLELRDFVFDRDGRVCAFCGSTEDLHIDHIKRVVDGGLPVPGNLRVLCRSCNLGRGSKG